MAFADDVAEMNASLRDEYGEGVTWTRGATSATIQAIPIFPKDPLALSGQMDSPPPDIQLEVVDSDFPSALSPGPASGDRVTFRGQVYVIHRPDDQSYGTIVVNLKKLS